MVYVDLVMKSLKKSQYHHDTTIYLFYAELFYARIVKIEIYGN